jgi:hypothetical protein
MRRVLRRLSPSVVCACAPRVRRRELEHAKKATRDREVKMQVAVESLKASITAQVATSQHKTHHPARREPLPCPYQERKAAAAVSTMRQLSTSASSAVADLRALRQNLRLLGRAGGVPVAGLAAIEVGVARHGTPGRLVSCSGAEEAGRGLGGGCSGSARRWRSGCWTCSRTRPRGKRAAWHLRRCVPHVCRTAGPSGSCM